MGTDEVVGYGRGLPGTYRLPQAHLVSQDAIQAIVVEGDKPLDAFELIRPQVSFDEGDQLLLDLHAWHSG